MSGLRARAGEYLAMRRALGFKLATQGRHLMSFVRFCEERSAGRVTTELAVEWATQAGRGSGDEVYQARKLDTGPDLRPAPAGARPGHRGPPEDVLSRRQGRARPYLYSPGEIAALMARCGRPRAAAEGQDMADADRAAGRDRDAAGRGMPPRP